MEKNLLALEISVLKINLVSQSAATINNNQIMAALRKYWNCFFHNINNTSPCSES